ncbi:probable multidrug resistance transporter, MFS superfamily (plasmid) [Rhodococcus jostii RHA1]|jgi:MFS family permease|uniref:Probable multidrug resistance transporter, MFS superfamily n=1 Tax=Rhodococcus jostii (strain RHA1) TaxID=101510 RepID=Q0RVX8_RHOJR|nr:probable multidrug resistance transporter, MFS superfamily [Rhodococcus jostii RHA1]
MTSVLTGRRSSSVIVVLLIAAIVEFLELNMIYVALPAMYKEYGDPAIVGWLVTSFALVAAVAAGIGGRLGDVIGARRVLVGALAVAVLGSLISALAVSFPMLLTGRALQGFSGAILPVAYGELRRVITPARLKTAIGLLSGGAFLGAALGFLSAGLAIQYFGWRSIFCLSAVLGVASAMLCLTLPRPTASTLRVRDIDFVGGTLFAPAVAAILLGVTQLRSWGIGDLRIVGLLVAGIALLGVWVSYELRHANPFFDIRLFRRPRFLASCVGIALFSAGVLSLAVLVSPIMQQSPATGIGFGLSASVYGVISMALAFVGFAFSPVGGLLSQRIGAARAAIIGATVSTIGIVGMMITLHSSVAMFLLFMVLAGNIGCAMTWASFPNLVVEGVPSSRTSEATGMQQVVKQVAQAGGLQLVSVLLAGGAVAGPGGAAVLTESSYRAALWYLVVLSVLVIPVVYLARRTPAEDVSEAAATTVPVRAGVAVEPS